MISRPRPGALIPRGRAAHAKYEPPPPPTLAILAPTNIVRIRPRQTWQRAIIGPPLPPVIAVLMAGVKPIASPRRLRPGHAIVAPAMPPSPTPGTPLSGMVVSRRIPPRRGIVSPFRTLGPAAGPILLPGDLSVLRPISESWLYKRRARWVWTARMSPPPDPISLYPLFRAVQLQGDAFRCRRGGWMLVNTPLPLGGPLVGLGFHVYSNTGVGDAINYVLPIATVYGLTWTSGALAYAGDWKFAVRAFNSYGEEQNLDAEVELLLDSAGNDISRRPVAPTGLRATAKAGGAVLVEWGYPSTDRAKLPTGFHVYIGTGGVPDYTATPATVSYSSGVALAFAKTYTGLTDGVTYTIGVRAFNTFGEDPNTTAVSVTADATGPLPVDSLTGNAV
jgi:hypothetical protein